MSSVPETDKLIRVGSRKSEVSINYLSFIIYLHSEEGLVQLFLQKTTTANNKTICSFFQLALVQTKHVIASLQKLYPKQKFEIRKHDMALTQISDQPITMIFSFKN